MEMSSRRGGGTPGGSRRGGGATVGGSSPTSSVGGGSVRSARSSAGGSQAGRKRPAGAAGQPNARLGIKRCPNAAALADPEGLNDEVQRLLDEIRSVDVEWPLVAELEEPADTRVGRLQAEEARLTRELDAMSAAWQEMLEEQRSITDLFAEVAPLNDELTELKTSMRELQAVVAEAPLARETAELLVEEQQLLVMQLEQAEHQSHLLVAKAEELAALVLETTDLAGEMGKRALEAELHRVLAEAEEAHAAVDSASQEQADQKGGVAQAQIAKVAAEEAADDAEEELKELQQELVATSQEVQAAALAPKEQQAELVLRMDVHQERKLNLETSKAKVSQRITVELAHIVEAEELVCFMRLLCCSVLF